MGGVWGTAPPGRVETAAGRTSGSAACAGYLQGRGAGARQCGAVRVCGRSLVAERASPPGLVVAGTGNCTLHHSLEEVLEQAQAQGVHVLRTSRVPRGGVREKPNERFPIAGTPTPAQARVRLMLELMQAPPA